MAKRRRKSTRKLGKNKCRIVGRGKKRRRMCNRRVKGKYRVVFTRFSWKPPK